MKIVLKETYYKYKQIQIDSECNKKLKNISKNIQINKINKDLENKYLKLWIKLGKKPSLLFLRCMCSISGIESHRYLPENIYYGMIEPVLNNRAFALPYNDKNFYERYLVKYKNYFPKTILRGISGVIYDEEYVHINDETIRIIIDNIQKGEEHIIKAAADTGGGRSLSVFYKEKGRFIINGQALSPGELIDLLKNTYNGNFVLQKRIKQHIWFDNLNNSSLNTVRLYSYRSVNNEYVHPLHAYVRFGKSGSIVDSSSQGGRTLGISQSGVSNAFASEKYGGKYHKLHFIEPNSESKVPFFNEMKKLAKEIAPLFSYHRLLGFDFVVDDNNNVRLLEVNNRNIGVINQQMNTGPLFGELTDEVIDYCLANKKSIFLYYYL